MAEHSTPNWIEQILDATQELFNASPPANASAPILEDLAAIKKAAGVLAHQIAQHDSSHHDLMNTIGTIQGYAELLEETPSLARTRVRKQLKAVIRVCRDDDKTPTKTRRKSSKKFNEPGLVLAVDDLEDNRILLRRLVRRSGHNVITASDGEEALELLDKKSFDVVLLDLLMPTMNGKSVLQQIKAEEKSRAIPVVMISGQQDMDHIVACIQAGADDYLLKPFNPVLLEARINAGIDRKRWHDREQIYRQQLERNERFIRATFGRYLSDTIVDELLEKPEGLALGGSLQTVTIMMSDIRQFTSLSEHLRPEAVVRLLNRYLGLMSDIILKHEGIIDEFQGDAVLAVFGAPHQRKDDAERAVQCALAMQRAMIQVNIANEKDGLPKLSMGIAINTGTVVAGNIGSERRSKYGVVGHPVNVTSRIEDQTNAHEVLVSQSTLDELKLANYRLGDERKIQAKGIEEIICVRPVLESLKP